MSEGTWNVSAPSLSAALNSRLTVVDPMTLPVGFSFTPRCRTRGLTLALASAGLLLTGLFMLSQIPSTPAVAVQLSAVGMLLVGGGFVVMYQAAQRLLGALTITDHGIVHSPSFGGFSIPWKQLSGWDVRDHSLPSAGLPVVRFWVQGDPTNYSIPADSLTVIELRALRRILRHYVPEQEQAD
jgi:hypothetical protein